MGHVFVFVVVFLSTDFICLPLLFDGSFISKGMTQMISFFSSFRKITVGLYFSTFSENSGDFKVKFLWKSGKILPIENEISFRKKVFLIFFQIFRSCNMFIMYPLLSSIVIRKMDRMGLSSTPSILAQC